MISYVYSFVHCFITKLDESCSGINESRKYQVKYEVYRPMDMLYLHIYKAHTYSMCTYCIIFFITCGDIRLFQKEKQKCIFRCSDLFLIGDTLSVVAKICNSSSKEMRPKFSLQQKTVYRASGSTNTSDKSLIKIVGDTIKLNSEETVSCQVKIPADVIYTLNNCEILSVDYYLKVCNNVICIYIYGNINLKINQQTILVLNLTLQQS